MEDVRIVSLFWARDEGAIDAARERYGALCRKIAFDLLGDREDALECENDVYLAAWNAIPPARPQSLRAYFGKLARNIALNRYDRRTAAKRGGEAALLLSELGEVVADGSVEDALEASHTAALIGQFLRSESAGNRWLFLRRYWYAEPLAELAGQLRCSESAVKTRLFRQRERLRAYLQKEGILL